MKISVLIPSRGRPEQLIRSVRALQVLASGNHEISYVVGCDHDDPDTVKACIALGDGIRAYVLQRRPSLGQIVNILAEQNPAEVYCSYADDVEMLEPGWDQHVVDAVTDHPDWVLWFRAKVFVDGEVVAENPYAVVPEKWRKAAGRIFTDYFPYWHDDGWLDQVFRFARGTHNWFVVDVKLRDDNRGKTHRLHDYPFWESFFWERDGERLAEAARIAEALGWPAVEKPEQYRIPRRPMFTQWQLDNRSVGGERTPEYMQALERAKMIYGELGAE